MNYMLELLGYPDKGRASCFRPGVFSHRLQSMVSMYLGISIVCIFKFSGTVLVCTNPLGSMVGRQTA